MGINDLVQDVGEWLKVPPAFVGALAIVILVALIASRAGSFHPIRMQIWRLLLGRLVVSSAEVGELVQRTDDLAKFRFVFGLRVRTLQQAERISRWAIDHDELPDDIKACGRRFDLERCRLLERRLPPTWLQLVKSGLALLFGLGASFSLMGLAHERALVQFKASGAYFWLAPDHATSVRGDERVSMESCRSPSERAPTRITPAEGRALCDELRKGTTREYVRKVVLQQRYLLASIAFVFMCLLVFAMKSIVSGNAALRMSRRLEASRVRASIAVRVAPRRATERAARAAASRDDKTPCS